MEGKMPLKNKVKPTLKQKAAVDNIVTGKFKSVGAAMRDAGYSAKSSKKPRHALINRRGVEVYLNKLDKMAQKRFSLCLRDKVMETYLDGLDAVKPYGKKEYPDHMARKAFADRFSEFFGWSREAPPTQGHAQYNFFMFDKTKQDSFNAKFKDFLTESYKKRR